MHQKLSPQNFPNMFVVVAAVGVDSTSSRITTIPIKQQSTSIHMPNLSRRITKAAEESAEATRRIAAAEQKIARSLIEMLDDDDFEESPPPIPKTGAVAPKSQPPRK